jgi:hypothetical protein
MISKIGLYKYVIINRNMLLQSIFYVKIKNLYMQVDFTRPEMAPQPVLDTTILDLDTGRDLSSPTFVM